jgi:hypothetical protein
MTRLRRSLPLALVFALWSGCGDDDSQPCNYDGCPCVTNDDCGEAYTCELAWGDDPLDPDERECKAKAGPGGDGDGGTGVTPPQ